jgi:ribosome-binding factor A
MGRSSSNSVRSQRQLRVGEVLRHTLIEILSRGEIHDETLAKTPVTISEVRVSPDLKHATAFVMPLGGDQIEDVLKSLNGHTKYMRGQVSRRVNQLRFAPEFRFIADESFAQSSSLDELLRSPHVSQDLASEQEIEGDQAADDGSES